ncbi:MAG: SPOR domain-containing protein [Betaproteobacteria bacterium]|nr:SPOR domain-containing protein [Betaproteobacteria bacterium]
MARASSPRDSASTRSGGIWSGIMIGLLVGLGGAVLIALWLGRNNPFTERSVSAPSTAAPAITPGSKPIIDPATQAAPVDSHYDFYHILPGNNAASPATPTPAAPSVPTPAARPATWLQLGSFADANQADDLKARLALMGFEASIQTVDLPDKGTRHRVRLGPFNATDLARVQTSLQQNGILATPVSAGTAATPAGH